jgi:hypothetical protein
MESFFCAEIFPENKNKIATTSKIILADCIFNPIGINYKTNIGR